MKKTHIFVEWNYDVGHKKIDLVGRIIEGASNSLVANTASLTKSDSLINNQFDRLINLTV